MGLAMLSDYGYEEINDRHLIEKPISSGKHFELHLFLKLVRTGPWSDSFLH